MRVIVCEDDQFYIDSILAIVRRWSEKRQIRIPAVSVYCSSEDAVEALASATPFDLAFLDIQFPGELNGLEVANHLRNSNEHMSIVFTTNYKDYALEGYKVNALRYLLKPVKEEQVLECLDIAYRQWKLLQNEFILIPAVDQMHQVLFRSICFVESRAHYLQIHLVDQRQEIRVRDKLTDFMKQLPEEQFVQCHRSFAVNLFYVQSISITAVLLSDGSEIPVRRNYWENSLSKLSFLFQGGLDGE